MHIRVLQLNNIIPVLESCQAWIAIQMKLIKKVLYLQGISGLTMQEGLSSPSGKGALSPTHKN